MCLVYFYWICGNNDNDNNGSYIVTIIIADVHAYFEHNDDKDDKSHPLFKARIIKRSEILRNTYQYIPRPAFNTH